ncbi:MAG: hypothetical protein ISR65_11065 [Bacteriovoracaceae bacterium]|nr:hypothetical protein [Bacteriovoracaceae bacterium]
MSDDITYFTKSLVTILSFFYILNALAGVQDTERCMDKFSYQPFNHDPCPNISNTVTDDQTLMNQQLEEFWGCLKTIYRPIDEINAKIGIFKQYSLPRKLDIQNTAVEQLVELVFDENNKLLRRGQYLDEQLDTLINLKSIRQKLLYSIGSKVFDAIDARVGFLKHFSNSPRLETLLGLRKFAKRCNEQQESQRRSGRSFAFWTMGIIQDYDLFDTSSMPLVFDYMYPFALEGIIPDHRDDLHLLSSWKNPLRTALHEKETLNSPIMAHNQAISTYRKVRNQRPLLKQNLNNLDPNAVKVLFVDSGFDFLSNPEFAQDIGSGENGRLRSFDYSDLHPSPWAPTLQELDHGTKVLAGFYNLLNTFSPQIRSKHKLNLGLWKVESTKNILSMDKEGNLPEDLGRFSSVSHPFLNGLRQLLDSEITQNFPDILATSLHAFDMSNALTYYLRRPNLILNTPWLWVMAAGNQQEDMANISDEQVGCFADVEASKRPDDRIICVGSAQLINNKIQIAPYSNYGDFVDVYTLESFDPKCDWGTSCSQVGITYAATLLKEKFPQLLAANIKSIILEASDEIQTTANTGATFKFFNPKTMMPKAFTIAKSMVGRI